MSASERIADVLEQVFRAAKAQRLLSPEAVVQVAENPSFRPSAFGQKQTFAPALLAFA